MGLTVVFNGHEKAMPLADVVLLAVTVFHVLPSVRLCCAAHLGCTPGGTGSGLHLDNADEFLCN